MESDCNRLWRVRGTALYVNEFLPHPTNPSFLPFSFELCFPKMKNLHLNRYHFSAILSD